MTMQSDSTNFDSHDCRVMDELERRYPSRSVRRQGILGYAQEELTRDIARHHTWLGRRPLFLDRCLSTEGEYDQMIVVLPLGSTWKAVNAAYSFLRGLLVRNNPGDMDGYEVSSDVRTFAHDGIVPLLDTQGEFSRYPFDHKIAFDLMFTMKLAMTKAMIGCGSVESIDSLYLFDSDPADVVNLGKRETRQLALVFRFKPLAI
jgi:hypothetical protein